MEKQILLTAEGLQNMELELEELKTVRRKEVAEKIKVALSYGDLSENSEYDDAKNEQAILEAKIANLTVTLKNAKVINENEISTEYVHVGSKVTIESISNGSKMTYHIVGSNEADPFAGKLSDESPVGKSLLGKTIDDIVDVETPGGIAQYKILEIGR